MKGFFKRRVYWGLPQRHLVTIGCVRGSRSLDKERTLESNAKTLRSPGVKGELSRFKLRENYMRCCRIYICGDPVHGPSSVRSGKAKMDINGRWSVR